MHCSHGDLNTLTRKSLYNRFKRNHLNLIDFLKDWKVSWKMEIDTKFNKRHRPSTGKFGILWFFTMQIWSHSNSLFGKMHFWKWLLECLTLNWINWWIIFECGSTHFFLPIHEFEMKLKKKRKIQIAISHVMQF